MTDSYQAQDKTMRDYLSVIFRRQSVILTTVLAVSLTVFLNLQLQTPMYSSTVKMLITAEKQISSPYYREIGNNHNVKETLMQTEIVTSKPVLTRVVRSLGLHTRPLDGEKKFATPVKQFFIDRSLEKQQKQKLKLSTEESEQILFKNTLANLKSKISIDPIRDTNMFNITVSDYDPEWAATIANTVSRSYVIFDLEQQLAELRLKYGSKYPTVQMITDNISALKRTLTGAPINDVDAIGPASVKIIEQATVPLKPSGKSKKTVFILAFLMSVFLGFLIAFTLDYADQTLKTPNEASDFLKIPFLGSIIRTLFHNKHLIKKSGRDSSYFRAYRELADNVSQLVKEQSIKTLMIASSTREESTGYVTANLAQYLYEELEMNVLIVDADLRESSLTKALRMKNEKGLADYLENKIALNDLVDRQDNEINVIPAGATERNPVPLLESGGMANACRILSDHYDLILFNGPSLKDHKDCSVLLSSIDAFLFVVEEGQTRRQIILKSLESIQKHKDKIKGFILTNRTFPIPGFVYKSI